MGKKKNNNNNKIKKDVTNKEENSESWCFVCKDGGNLRICDHKTCLKSFHPFCVDKDDSFLESEEHWTCDWHICFYCYKSSKFRCYTCQTAVCSHCLLDSDFLPVTDKYGFCNPCLKLALLIEEQKGYDSDGDKVDFYDRETREGLFYEYYMIIKEEEGFQKQDIYSAQVRLKKKIKKNQSGSDSEEEFDADSEDEEQVSDYEEKRTRKRKGKKCEKTPKKSTNQMEFVGWASKPLMEFLNSIGKKVTEQLSQGEVTSIVNEYVKKNKLINQEKRKMIICDERLKKLFKRKMINKFSVSDRLEVHFTENLDESEEDEMGYDSEYDDNASISIACKKRKKMDVEKKMEKNEVQNDVDKCRFAAIVDENVKLVYLKKSVLYELLKEEESFEEKVIGCFVRTKTDQYDYCAKTSFQLRQVKGVKAVAVGENNVDTVLLFSTLPKEIKLSLVSNCDFSKEECEDLREKVLSGQLERPTVGELQEKAKVVHKDITKHTIHLELAVLDKKIDQANEKGWRQQYFEYLKQRSTLQSPSEQSKLLENVPKVIPDISELDSTSGDDKEDIKSDEGSPTSTVECNNTVVGKLEEKARAGHASPPENVPCKKEEEDDIENENANDAGKVTSSILNGEKLDDNVESETWWILGPFGEKSSCPFSVLKNWNKRTRYAAKFKVWKEGQNEKDAIPLPEAINIDPLP